MVFGSISSNKAELAALARHASGIGWVQAHVHVRRSYPLIAVRVSRVGPEATTGRILDNDDPLVLQTAAYAIALAREVDRSGARVNVVEVEASVRPGPRAELNVRLSVGPEDGQTAAVLSEPQVVDMARQVMAEEWVATFGAQESAGIAVELEGATSAAPPAAETVAAAEPTPVEEVAAEVEPTVAEAAAEVEPHAVEVAAEVDKPTVEARVPIEQEPRAAESVVEEAPADHHVLAQEEEPPRRGRRGVLVVAAALLVAAVALVAFQALQGAASRPDGVEVSGAQVAPTSVPAPATAVPTIAAAPTPLAGAQVQPTATSLPPTPTAVAIAPTATNVPPPAPVLSYVAGATARPGWLDNPQSVAWFGDDGYHLAARTPGQFVALGLSEQQDFSNVEVAAVFHKVSGPPGGGYGVILRDAGPGPRDGLNQRGSYLVFEIGDDGRIGIWRRDQDQWIDIVGWTPSSAVRTGTGENTLAVRAVDAQLEFNVNGTSVATVNSTQPGAGGVGVFLGGDGNAAVLTRFSVTPLP